MKIVLNNGFFILAEERSYTLKRKTKAVNKTTGEPYEAVNDLGYYFTVAQALTAYARKTTDEAFVDQEITLDQYTKELARNVDAITDLIQDAILNIPVKK